MRVGVLLLAISLLYLAPAGAQGPAGAGGNTQAGPAGPTGPTYHAPLERVNDPWQFAVGYQYNRDNLLGSPFNTHGMNFDLDRYFGRWFGLEAQVGVGFLGKTDQTTNPPNLSAKSLYVGGGPRLAYRNGNRFQPWVHLTVGLEHYRFSQTAGVLGSNNGFAGDAGGGIDIFLRTHVGLRFEVDAVGSRFFSTNQRSFQAVGGLVFGF